MRALTCKYLWKRAAVWRGLRGRKTSTETFSLNPPPEKPFLKDWLFISFLISLTVSLWDFDLSVSLSAVTHRKPAAALRSRTLSIEKFHFRAGETWRDRDYSVHHRLLFPFGYFFPSLTFWFTHFFLFLLKLFLTVKKSWSCFILFFYFSWTKSCFPSLCFRSPLFLQ